MLYYRDMTFCTYWEDCGEADECHRPLNKQVKKEAEKWWGNEDAPIAIFVEKPTCWEEKKDD